MRAMGARAGRDGVVAGLAGTTLVHGLVLLTVVLLTLRPEVPSGTVYAVNLVAAPATATGTAAPAVEATPRPPAPVERTAPINPPRRTA